MRQPWFTIAGGAFLLAVLAAGCGGMRMSWGRPDPSTVFVVQQPTGQRFDYLVHVTNAERRMDQQTQRFAAVRKALAGHCTPEHLTDLYAHTIGPRTTGNGELLSYTVGVRCAPEH